MKRLAFFSAYISDKYASMPDYILYYLAQIRPHVETLVFIYNEDFNLAENAKLSALVDDIMPVKNEGYDFGMWQKALKKHNVQHYDELCLFNDSCVCVKDLDLYFNWHSAQVSADITSFTSSLEQSKHLQSYFLCIKKKAIPIVVNWILKQNFELLDYKEIVICGEIGLSIISRFNDLTLRALVDTPTEANLTLDCPEELIKLGLPLVKKKALERDTSKKLALQESERASTSFLTEIIQQRYDLSFEQCQQLFSWLPVYVINGVAYEGIVIK